MSASTNGNECARFIKAARDAKAPGATKVRKLEDYKKEVAEATGLDVSGKVDKSQALMAFGLALMQNRAGKGFNVGKMSCERPVEEEKQSLLRLNFLRFLGLTNLLISMLLLAKGRSAI